MRVPPPPLTALHFSDGETKVREMKNFPHATYSVQQSQVSNPDPQTLDAFWVQHIVCPGGGPAPGSTGGQQLRRGGGMSKTTNDRRGAGSPLCLARAFLPTPQQGTAQGHPLGAGLLL